MYGQCHLRNSDSRQQARKGAPLFTMTAAERIARWEAKQAAEKAAKEASK